jgi:glutaredoxin
MPSEPIAVTIYTRQGCHLCEKAHDLLAAFAQTYPVAVELIEIDLDAALTKRYGEKVPVVVVNGRERFWGCIQPALLRRLLVAETARRRGF